MSILLISTWTRFEGAYEVKLLCSIQIQFVQSILRNLMTKARQNSKTVERTKIYDDEGDCKTDGEDGRDGDHSVFLIRDPDICEFIGYIITDCKLTS